MWITACSHSSFDTGVDADVDTDVTEGVLLCENRFESEFKFNFIFFSFDLVD